MSNCALSICQFVNFSPASLNAFPLVSFVCIHFCPLILINNGLATILQFPQLSATRISPWSKLSNVSGKKCYTVDRQVIVILLPFDSLKTNVFYARHSLQIVDDIIDNFLFYRLACSPFYSCSFILNVANLVNISHISKPFVQKRPFVHEY